MKTLPKTAIITINWRNCGDTIECVESLLEQDYPVFQIFILDNGSYDGSAEKLEEWGRLRLGDDFLSCPAEQEGFHSFHQKVVLLRSQDNLGFAGGNNFACRQALCAGAHYIWFINNDTVHDGRALRALVNVAEAYDHVGMVCSKVLYFDRPEIIESVGSMLIAPLGIFRHLRQGDKDPGAWAPEEVPYIYGCSFLVNAGLPASVGFMDERYFLLREEGDWSIRARKKGWKLYCAPDSKVWHKGTVSIGKRSETFFYYVTRNTLLFMKEHYPLFLPTTALSMVPLIFGLILVDTLFSGRKLLLGRLRAVFFGYCHFFKAKFGGLTT
jgi:GT2 family glycosyltransferase